MAGNKVLKNQESKRADQRGFSLIELLVVIAIIAILAAILFPIFATVQENVRKTTCMSQMHEVYRALQLYKTDNNKYPGTLYGYAENPDGSLFTGAGTPVPIGQVKARPLFAVGKYLQAWQVFQCPDNTPAPNQQAVTTVVYPTFPGVTLSGQVKNSSKPLIPAYLYFADSYSLGPQVDTKGNAVKSGGMNVMEVHYSLSWTNVTGPGDAVNQLKYPDPPQDKTVITWCSYHAAVAHNPVIPVLMLSGTVKPVPVEQFVRQGPLTFSF